MMSSAASSPMQGNASSSGNERPVPAEVLDAAIAWQLRLEDDPPIDVAQAWREWLAAHADHMRAWRQIGQIGQQWGALAQLAPGPAAKAALLGPKRGGRLRAAGTALGLAAATLLGLAVLDRFQPVDQLLADYRTGTGERRTIVLPDQTMLHLNTRSAVDLAFDENLRAVRLREGEIIVETRHADAQERRPFVVVTPDGSLRALGTVFTVRRLDGQDGEEGGGTQLTVTQSAVAARPTGCAIAPTEPCAGERIVPEGQTARLRDSRVDTPEAAAPDADAWKDGMLVVENQSLAEVVATLARHRPGRLAVDPRVAHLRVTGTLPLADTDQALLALTAAVPVEVAYATWWWVTLRPRVSE